MGLMGLPFGPIHGLFQHNFAKNFLFGVDKMLSDYGKIFFSTPILGLLGPLRTAVLKL
jgi:hypothetical protein